MIPEKTIQDLLDKHSILEKELSKGDIDKKNFAEKSKEYSNLNEIVENAKSYIKELEKFIETRISSISTSPERNDTILILDPFNL